VVFVLGFDHNDEGEYVAGDEADNYTESKGGDRKTLALHTDEAELVRSVGPENNNSVVVLIGGNTITISEWQDSVSAILMAYYPGQEGGTAIAEILFGDINPSGKLPFVIPVKESELPQINWDTGNVYYHYYHGYAKLEKEGKRPLFPYGFGLSYTTFALSKPDFRSDEKTVTARCVVTNTGKWAGTEVVQMYTGFKNSRVDRPVKLLRGFKRVTLEPGASATVEISCPVERLRFYNPQAAVFELEHMDYEVYIGSSSADSDLLSGSIIL
jgi:beta-glucosidase